jgi:hypothetical protein
MSRVAPGVPTPARSVLLALLATALLALTPGLTLSTDGTSAVAAAALALLLTAISGHQPLLARLALAGRTTPAGSSAATATLRTAVTDRVHHPLRPRAPGTV